MEPSFRYSDQATQAIAEYLKGIPEDMHAMVAAEELRRELRKLALNPTLGTAPTGPFETRPIHRFQLESGDRRRLAQVSYRVRGSGEIDILLFSATPN